MFTKLSLLAGAALLLGAASSAEAQCSHGSYGGGYYNAPYVDYYSHQQPVYQNYGYAPVYGYENSYVPQGACSSNYGRPQHNYGRTTSSCRTQQYVRPRVVFSVSSGCRQPVYAPVHVPYISLYSGRSCR